MTLISITPSQPKGKGAEGSAPTNEITAGLLKNGYLFRLNGSAHLVKVSDFDLNWFEESLKSGAFIKRDLLLPQDRPVLLALKKELHSQIKESQRELRKLRSEQNTLAGEYATHAASIRARINRHLKILGEESAKRDSYQEFSSKTVSLHSELLEIETPALDRFEVALGKHGDVTASDIILSYFKDVFEFDEKYVRESDGFVKGLTPLGEFLLHLDRLGLYTDWSLMTPDEGGDKPIERLDFPDPKSSVTAPHLRYTSPADGQSVNIARMHEMANSYSMDKISSEYELFYGAQRLELGRTRAAFIQLRKIGNLRLEEIRTVLEDPLKAAHQERENDPEKHLLAERVEAELTGVGDLFYKRLIRHTERLDMMESLLNCYRPLRIEIPMDWSLNPDEQLKILNKGILEFSNIHEYVIHTYLSADRKKVFRALSVGGSKDTLKDTDRPGVFYEMKHVCDKLVVTQKPPREPEINPGFFGLLEAEFSGMGRLEYCSSEIEKLDQDISLFQENIDRAQAVLNALERRLEKQD